MLTTSLILGLAGVLLIILSACKIFAAVVLAILSVIAGALGFALAYKVKTNKELSAGSPNEKFKGKGWLNASFILNILVVLAGLITLMAVL